MKPVRFASLIDHSGRPELHLAWSTPAADSVLQAALKQHRVLTVHQQVRGSKKDFGVVGLDPARDAQFLIFPKSLRKFSDRHVVGIRYDLLAEAISASPALPARKPRKLSPAPPTAAEITKFPLPEAETPKIEVRREPIKPLLKSAPPPKPLGVVESDPVRIEVRKALADISAGRTAKAKRRLLSLLT